MARRFIISIAVTVLILLAEVIGGIWTGSLALLSDSAHVFMDIFALALSYLALRLSSLPADDRHTYGYHRLEVLAALVNGVTLGAIALGIWWEAIIRWQNPTQIRSQEMLIIATIGLIANVVVAFVLGAPGHADEADHAHSHPVKEDDCSDPPRPRPVMRDLNVHSAFLHVVGDAVSSVGVMIAAVLVWQTGWNWVDPLVSILIGILIVISAVRVLRSSVHILIEGVPEGMDINRIGDVIQSIQAVSEVHDLHVWNICSGRVALSSHVVLDPGQPREKAVIMADMKHQLSQQFGIEHTTIQFEDVACNQR